MSSKHVRPFVTTAWQLMRGVVLWLQQHHIYVSSFKVHENVHCFVYHYC